MHARRNKLAEVLLHKMDQTVSVLAATRAKARLPSSLRTCGREIDSELIGIKEQCRVVVEDPASSVELPATKELTTKCAQARTLDSLIVEVAVAER